MAQPDASLAKVVAVQQAEIAQLRKTLDTTSKQLDNLNGSQFDSAMRQMQAQATCVALKPSGGWTFAVSRTDGTKSCDQLCGSMHEDQAGQLSCFNALHVYQANDAATAGQTLGYKTYKYNTCTNLNFGPNFCCCGP